MVFKRGVENVFISFELRCLIRYLVYRYIYFLVSIGGLFCMFGYFKILLTINFGRLLCFFIAHLK